MSVFTTSQRNILQRRARMATLPLPVRPTRAPEEESGSLDWSRVEVRMSSRKLDDLVDLVEDDLILKDKQCSICLEGFSKTCERDQLSIRPRTCEYHLFHLGCIQSWLKTNASCPLCRTQLIIVTGFQPQGLDHKLSVATDTTPLPGHDECRTIKVWFHFEPSLQATDAPLPGEAHDGFDMITYLPDNNEGQEVLRLLRLAWKRRLLFRIGFNPVTKRMNRIVSNGLDLKYAREGGILRGGYPDPSYLSRLKSDLREIGVK